MDRNLPIVPTIVFIALLIGLVLFYAIRSTHLLDFPIQQISQDSQGNLWAVLETDLIQLDQPEQIISFAAKGVKSHVGQMVPMNDGGWLINRGAQESFLARSVRRAGERDETLYQNKSSLLQCNSRLTECMPWGETALQFERAFDGVALSNGKYLLFNPVKNKAYLVSESGVIEDKLKNKEYWFGASKVTENKFLATNTAKDQLEIIEVTDNKLNSTEFKVDVKNLASGSVKLFDLSKSLLVDDQVWVMASKGQRLSGVKALYKIDTLSDGFPVFKTSVSYTEIADFEYYDGEFYFTEYDGNFIQTYNPQSDVLSVLDSPTLNTVILNSQTKKKQAKNQLWYVISLGGLGLFACLIWMLKSSSPVTEAEKKQRSSIFGNKFSLHDVVDYQIDKSSTVKIPFSAQGKRLKKYLNLYKYGMPALVFLIVVIMVFSILDKGEPISSEVGSVLVLSLAVLLLMMGYMAYLISAVTPKLLFVKSGALHWYAKKGRTFTFDTNTLVYTKNVIADQNVNVIINNHKMGVIYDIDTLEKYVIPIIQQGEEVNEIGYYKHQLKNNLSKCLIHITVITILIVLTIFIKFT